MKKLILRLSLLLGVLLLLTGAALAADALEGAASMDGSDYTVTVSLTAQTEVTSGKLELTYDAAQLTLVSAEPSAALQKSIHSINTRENGKVVFTFLQLTPVKGEDLVTLTFRAADGAEQPVVNVTAKELYLRLTKLDGNTLTLQPEKPQEPDKPDEPDKPEETPCDGGAGCVSRKFSDVDAGQWYHPYIDYAVSHNLFGGTSPTTFEPEAPMTRAMLVTVLWRYEGQPKGYLNTFSDVNAKEGSWYIDAVAWAAANGVVNGVGDGQFDPDGRVTREQIATILYRYAQKKGIDTATRGNTGTFPDAAAVSAYASDAMRWAVGVGLINGSDGKLLPQGDATRSQVATLLMRFAETVAK